jgi:acyl-homoserine-lactone acylase
MEPDFTALDAHAREVQTWSRSDAERFVRSLEADSGDAPGGPAPDEGYAIDGSNAWALHPDRTSSGSAILLRNPHLTWGAGYYEAHVRVPGVVEFYGDFRIGGAFGIIGGFNRHLGWATTNNYPRYSQVYALAADPEREDHYLLDGRSHALVGKSVTVDFLKDDGDVGSETRTTAWTPFGPVIHRTDETIYILKDPRDGLFRRGEQFFRMMRAGSLTEWLDVMLMRAHPSSNFTYADAEGNIAHFYNARLPLLPHEPTGDAAVLARSHSDIWTRLVPVHDLPLYVNPPGGYVQQANDTPDYTNLNVPMDRDTMPVNLPDPRLRLRSQLSLELIHGDAKLSLEDVVELKHSPRMLVAERVLDGLLNAARDARRPSLDEALEVLASWDRTAAAESRGGVLFKAWYQAYSAAMDATTFYREAWSPERPMETPAGIGDPEAAVSALAAVVDARAAHGLPLDIAWGAVHRVVRGDVDLPVSGCEATLGCFRTLSFAETEDGRLAANRGDAWVFAVEFGEVPRAFSVLAYGQSPKENSPHHADQAAMFAQGRMKTVAWTDADIQEGTVRRYRPGG